MTEALKQFQLEFGRYLRDPNNTELPQGINPPRAKIYEDLLFNNVRGFINNCFPVCRSLVEEQQWVDLSRSFYRDWRASSPYFHDIPQEFLAYLQDSDTSDLAPWFLELAHYEWIELVVDIAADAADVQALSKHTEAALVRANPSLQNLAYEWPVHRISSSFQPQEKQQTFLAVYRDADFEVQFTELNPATSALISLVQQAPSTRRQLMDHLAQLFPGMAEKKFTQFVNEIVDKLIQQQLLHEA